MLQVQRCCVIWMIFSPHHSFPTHTVQAEWPCRVNSRAFNTCMWIHDQAQRCCVIWSPHITASQLEVQTSIWSKGMARTCASGITCPRCGPCLVRYDQFALGRQIALFKLDEHKVLRSRPMKMWQSCFLIVCFFLNANTCCQCPFYDKLRPGVAAFLNWFGERPTLSV